MIITSPHTPRLYTLGGMGVALLFFTLGFYGFPSLQYSNWNDELIALFLFAFAAASALWLFIGAAAGWLSFSYPRHNWLLHCWVAWVAWQLVPTLLAVTPWRSWFGPPEQSEGMAWYLCASVLMLHFAALWYSERFRKTVLACGFIAMVLLAVLHFISDEQNNIFGGFIFSFIPENTFAAFLPYVWPDYLGFMAAWWWLALMLTFPALSFARTLALGLCMLFVLLASSNHGAFAIISYGLLITLVARAAQAWGTRHFAEATPLWRKLSLIAILLPFVWLIASPYLTMEHGRDGNQSLPARILYNHITMSALAHEPSRLLVGKGWGQSEDDFYKYALVSDLRIYDENGKHNPNWPMLRGYNYHSHNMAAETLLSLGALGFLLWIALPILALRGLNAREYWSVAPVLIAVTILLQLWFTMPQCMPYQALCWFLLIHHYPASGDQRTIRRAHSAAGFALALLLSGWSAFAQLGAVQYSLRMTDPYGKFSGIPLTAEMMQDDLKRGGDRLRAYFISTTKRMVQAQARLEPKHLDLYRNYIESAEKMAADPRVGAYSGMAILYGYNVLMSNLSAPILSELHQRASYNYFPMALLHTKRAPYREDAIAPYLHSIYLSNRSKAPEAVMGVVQELLAINPSHRSALWLGGYVLSTQAGYEEQGVEMMRAALALGAAKVYPIPDKEIEEFQAQKSLKPAP